MNYNSPGKWTLAEVAIVILFSILMLFGLVFITAMLMGIPGGLFGFLGNFLSSTFSTSGGRVFWYITRSAGIMAYLLFWLSTLWGFMLASKIFGPVLNQGYAFDFHEFISLLSLFFLSVHILPLLFDTYQPFSLLQLFFPFISAYRPLWVGVGIIGMYIGILVTVSFYARKYISVKNFSIIHQASVLGYLAVLLHGIYSGADSGSFWVQQLYLWSALLVVFFGVYWFILHRNEMKVSPTAVSQPTSPKAIKVAAQNPNSHSASKTKWPTPKR